MGDSIRTIHLEINGFELDISAYHAEMIVDTLLGNTLAGSAGWAVVAVTEARADMRKGHV